MPCRAQPGPAGQLGTRASRSRGPRDAVSQASAGLPLTDKQASAQLSARHPLRSDYRLSSGRALQLPPRETEGQRRRREQGGRSQDSWGSPQSPSLPSSRVGRGGHGGATPCDPKVTNYGALVRAAPGWLTGLGSGQSSPGGALSSLRSCCKSHASVSTSHPFGSIV